MRAWVALLRDSQFVKRYYRYFLRLPGEGGFFFSDVLEQVLRKRCVRI